MSVNQRLTVSLAALTHNYRLCQTHHQGDVGAVVKADAYGLGAGPIAGQLLQDGCQHFFVATLAEARQLRATLADRPAATEPEIYVLEGLLESPQAYGAQQLTPILNTLDQCRRWAATGLPMVLHVDTGLQRLGLSSAEFAQLMSESTPDVSLLMTHFACADEVQHPANAQQLQHFQQLRGQLESVLQRQVTVSVGNTAGLLQFDCGPQLSRAGVGLYGGNPFSGADNPFRPVVCLEGQVLQLRELPAETPVGYGATYITHQPTRIATIGLGYADGVPRLLSNCGRVWLRDGYVPIVGRVSMDLLTVDVSQLGEVNPGDWVEVIGSHISLDEVAAHAQTISYEILTGLSRRASRVYQQELLAQ